MLIREGIKFYPIPCSFGNSGKKSTKGIDKSHIVVYNIHSEVKITVNNLVEAIKQHQRDRSLSDNQLAKLLGIDRSTWAYIKCGKRNPGMKFLRAIGREIPTLEPLIYVEITDTVTPSRPHRTQDKILATLRAFRHKLFLWLRGV